MKKRLTSVLSIGAVAASLTLGGCASAPTQAQGNTADDTLASFCERTVQPGLFSDNVRISGIFADRLTSVIVPDAVEIPYTQQTITPFQVGNSKEKSEEVAETGSLLSLHIALIDTQSKKVLYETDTTGEQKTDFVLVPFPASVEFAQNVTLGEALRCAKPGERHTIAFNDEDSKALASSFRVETQKNVLAVVDVQAVSSGNQTGDVVQLPNGFPAITFDDRQNVGVVMPPTAPPTEERIAQAAPGKGRVIEENDTLVIQSFVVQWDGEAFPGSNWKAAPQLIPSNRKDILSWRKDLNGARVGAVFVVLDPAAENQTPARAIVLRVLAVG